MENKKHTDLKDRKQIGLDFINKAYTLYPEWRGPLILPKPIYPQKLVNVDISNKQMAQVPLDDITKSVICGTVFSDSSLAINKNYKNARFQAKHSTRQYTWFVWKYLVVLKEFTSESGLVYTKPDGFQAKSPLNKAEGEEILGKLKITSHADSKLTELHKIICVNNRKTIQRSWLNHMNNYFLMTVWLDDGGLIGEKGKARQGIISFNSIPVAEQLIFRDYLLKVWGIKTSESNTNQLLANGQPNLRIAIADLDSLLNLLRIIAPIVPVREMLYKLCCVPKDMSLLQRWRTELKGLVRPEFQSDIDKIYDQTV